jgi:hypothetical protein
MKKDLLNAVQVLIEQYKDGSHEDYLCPLCPYDCNVGNTCEACPNIAFGDCCQRGRSHDLNFINKEHYSNLVVFWSEVHKCLKSASKSQLIPKISEEVQQTIREIAEPWKL